jgi:hypothetical protein
MISRIRNRLGPAGFVLAIIALVAALAGGAYAASGGLTGKQKKEVKQIAKSVATPGPAGKQGPAGANGKDGSNGANGAKGDKGDPGTPGTNGTNGTNGKSVEVGIATSGPSGECEEGGATVQVAGEPSTKKAVCNGALAPEELPEGKIETGTWRFVSNGAVEQFAPISFAVPLAQADAEGMTVETFAKGAASTANCPGKAEEPRAAPGVLCVYMAEIGTSFPTAVGKPAVYKPTKAGEELGVTPGGAFLYFENVASGQTAGGTFAVRAPLGS